MSRWSTVTVRGLMGLTMLVLVTGIPADARASARERRLESAAQQAYIWGMPLVEAAMIRTNWARGGKDAPPVPLNRFRHRRQLAGSEMRSGVGPNNDTIYSTAWVDLADGPLVMTTPDFGGRYYTFSINFADSSAEQSLGQRTHGGRLPPLFLHGPGYRGPVPGGMVDVPAHTRYVNIAGRMLVRGSDDQAEVNALQDRILLVRWNDWQAGRHIPASPPARPPAADIIATGEDEATLFFRRLATVLRDWSFRPGEGAPMQALRDLGLTSPSGFRAGPFPATERHAIAEGYRKGKAMVVERSLHLGIQANGWTTNYAGPRFGRDWLLRAAVAKDQIFVAVPEEAIYPVGRLDSKGRPLTGSCRYRIRFAPGALPPVDAFWSVTAYSDDGFMIPNPIGRYSVGDRTEGLRRAGDGSVTILLSRADPHDRDANWLPVGDGRFYLMMRLYRPRPAVAARTWMPPPIEPDEGCS